MAIFLLIRHGDTDWVRKRLAGRLPGIPLNGAGRTQAARLAMNLGAHPIDLICTSPLERTRETAAGLAANLDLLPRVCPEFTEIDYGDWTGRTFADMAASPEWRAYNRNRSVTRVPGGELMVEIQARMIAGLLALHHELPDGMVAVFSHGDPIRTALAHFAAIDLDHFLRLRIDPGSVSIVALHDAGPQILGLNLQGEIPELKR
jgi:broad specificity phosphatase PhoE